MKIKELNIKQIRDLNKDGWAVFVAKNKEMFVYRGGWPTQNGITLDRGSACLRPLQKGQGTPPLYIRVMKKARCGLRHSDRAIILP